MCPFSRAGDVPGFVDQMNLDDPGGPIVLPLAEGSLEALQQPGHWWQRLLRKADSTLRHK